MHIELVKAVHTSFPDAEVAVSPKGWTDNSIFLETFAHFSHSLPSISEHSYKLVLYDGPYSARNGFLGHAQQGVNIDSSITHKPHSPARYLDPSRHHHHYLLSVVIANESSDLSIDLADL